jgi:hypothetical protein
MNARVENFDDLVKTLRSVISNNKLPVVERLMLEYSVELKKFVEALLAKYEKDKERR